MGPLRAVQEETANFLRDNNVEVIASPPYFLAQRVVVTGLHYFDGAKRHSAAN